MNDSDWQLSTTIKSIPEKGCELVCTIREKLTELAWPENDVFKIHLALEEIIMNAIKHGNQLNPDKNVTVNCDVAAGVFTPKTPKPHVINIAKNQEMSISAN